MVLFYPIPVYFGIWEYRFNLYLSIAYCHAHWNNFFSIFFFIFFLLFISSNIIETGGLEFLDE